MDSSLSQLREYVGVEHSLEAVSHALHRLVLQQHAPLVGAMHLTCADEAEFECTAAFQQSFVRHVVPPLKFAEQAPFRLANLGAQYEWGALRVAEGRYAVADPAAPHKVLVLKINAHVAYRPMSEGPVFGRLQRYRGEAACCGALAAMLNGTPLPHVEGLVEAFHSEGGDRLAALRDPARVEPGLRPLFAAVVNARLQARKASLDAMDHNAATPTLYWIVPCVTLNRPDRDSEIVCGYYRFDARDGEAGADYYGLGDDPAEYRLETRNQRVVLRDPHLAEPRRVRDHRQLIREHLAARGDGALASFEDERLLRLREDVKNRRHHDPEQARLMLRAALAALAQVAPVPGALLLFGNGLAGIHHAFRVHRLARRIGGSDAARRILDEIHATIDDMPAEQAAAVIELLAREYRR